ncbi:MAG: site-specific recombinase, invertase Pin [Lacrimispora sp.]|jgi:DNA invertase Pin-like site-specific DNA recombinase|nr:site-specific recombinase, invertase Pin [Lacrimispora sp.]
MDAIYARQSIDKKDSLSIETQLSFARRMAIGEPRLYIDRGISGKDVVHRPEFLKLLNDIKTGTINRILVYKLDRFTRSLLDFTNTWEYMSKYKVEFISVTENFDTSTPIGKAMIFIMAVFAQMEREQISRRVYDNYYDRIELGRWPGGPAPYGYGNTTVTQGDKKVSSLKLEDNIKVLEEIMKVYAYPTTSLGDIGRMMTARQCPGPNSEKWSPCSVGRVLRNPASVKCDHAVYTYFKKLGVNMINSLLDFNGEHGGMLVGKKGAVTKGALDSRGATFAIGNWPGYIDSEIWLRCQRKLDNNEKVASNDGPRNSWLTGLLKCAGCGRAVMVRKYKRKSDDETVRTIRCRGKDFLDCDSKPQMRIEQIEDSVQTELQKLLDRCRPAPIEISDGTNELELQLIRIEEAVTNLMQVLKTKTVSSLTVDYVNKELEELTETKEKLLEEKERLVNKSVFPEKILFSQLSKEDKRAVAFSYLETVMVKDDSISLIWKV